MIHPHSLVYRIYHATSFMKYTQVVLKKARVCNEGEKGERFKKICSWDMVDSKSKDLEPHSFP